MWTKEQVEAATEVGIEIEMDDVKDKYHASDVKDDQKFLAAAAVLRAGLRKRQRSRLVNRKSGYFRRLAPCELGKPTGGHWGCYPSPPHQNIPARYAMLQMRAGAAETAARPRRTSGGRQRQGRQRRWSKPRASARAPLLVLLRRVGVLQVQAIKR